MIYISSDHRGLEVKNQIIDILKESNYDFNDLGPYEYLETDDYPDYAFALGEKVVATNSKGIIVCYSGIGVTVAVNKVKGIRGGYVESVDHAIKSRTDDDINVLVLDAMTFNKEKDAEIIKKWIETPFSNEPRHVRRLNKITLYENRS